MTKKMKLVAIHSHKGGVGKTTIALNLAKQAAKRGKKVCVVDCDFIGAGVADLIKLKRSPKSYIDTFLLAAEPHKFEIHTLIGEYTDKGIGKKQVVSIILSLFRGARVGKNQRAESKRLAAREDEMLRLAADESNYREIQMKMPVLIEGLEALGYELVVVDCHPGLGLVSTTLRSLVDLNLFITTPNRSDCFGLLKQMNIRRLDNKKAFVVLNMAQKPIFDLVSFQKTLKRDPLLKPDSGALLDQLSFVGQRDAHFVVLQESEVFRRAFYIGQAVYLPDLQPEFSEFAALDKILCNL